MGIARLILVAALALPGVASPQAEATAPKPNAVRFDPAKVVTIHGTVLGEQRVDHGQRGKSVHLVVKVGDDQVSVHLGPASVVDRQAVKLAKGDEVTVKGSRFDYDGRYGVIAQEVTRGSDRLVLRDANGKLLKGAPAAPAAR